MLTGLDHIIIGVSNLEQAEMVFSQKLGLAVTGGGVHPFGGTANRVVVVGEVSFPLGNSGQSFELAAPSSPSLDAGKHMPGPAGHLRAFGESLYRTASLLTEGKRW